MAWYTVCVGVHRPSTVDEVDVSLLWADLRRVEATKIGATSRFDSTVYCIEKDLLGVRIDDFNMFPRMCGGRSESQLARLRLGVHRRTVHLPPTRTTMFVLYGTLFRRQW